MTIKVETQDNFQGVVQSRDHKKPECSSYGENSKVTFLRINLLAKKQDKDYCGVFLSEVINCCFVHPFAIFSETFSKIGL